MRSPWPRGAGERKAALSRRCPKVITGDRRKVSTYSRIAMNTARVAGPCGLNLRRRPSNVLQCLFAQDIGIAFSGSCKFDDLRSDGSFDAVVAVSDPQSDANHFEGNA